MRIIKAIFLLPFILHTFFKNARIYEKENGIKILILALLFSSCASVNKAHYQKIHPLSKTGSYTIKSLKNNVAKFNEVAGEYIVLSDTLKKGDTIKINVIRK